MVSHPVKHNQSSRNRIRVLFPHRPFHAATQSVDSTSYRTFKYQPLHLHHPMSHLELKQIPNIPNIALSLLFPFTTLYFLNKIARLTLLKCKSQVLHPYSNLNIACLSIAFRPRLLYLFTTA